MAPPYLIRVAAKVGSTATINARWKSQFGDELIWTTARIAEHIRAVQAGHIESLAHLRDQLNTIEDWNRHVPEFAEDCGAIPIADHETTITEIQLLELRRRVLFLERHRILFQEISDLDDAYNLMGGRGSSSGIAANSSPVPSAPRSVIYRCCVRYHRLDLWLDFHAFRETPTSTSWNTLKQHTIPWECDRTVEQLTEYRSSSWSANPDSIPGEMDVRRALTPCETSPGDPDELPDIPASSAAVPNTVAAAASDNILEFRPPPASTLPRKG